MIDNVELKSIFGIEKIGSFKVLKGSIGLDGILLEADIPIHKCTEQDRAKFFKPKAIYQTSFDEMFTQFFCIKNPELLYFNGDYNSDI
jgi:hypothetical protein